MKKKIKKQPKRQKGFSFTAWAVFSWGISHDKAFRTRKEAIDFCREHGWIKAHGDVMPTWKQVKSYMQVAKVQCTIIK